MLKKKVILTLVKRVKTVNKEDFSQDSHARCQNYCSEYKHWAPLWI